MIMFFGANMNTACTAHGGASATINGVCMGGAYQMRGRDCIWVYNIY